MSVALTYNLTEQCGGSKPFCRPCENSFSLRTCLPKCEEGPTVICLKPKIPAEIGTCDSCKDHITPKKFLAYVVYLDGNNIGPYIIESYSSPLTCDGDCQFASDSIINYPVSHFRGHNGVGSVGAQFCSGNIGYWAINDGFGAGFISGYDLVTDITTGDGCQQVLVFNNTFSNSTGFPPSPPDGSIMYLYPIPEDTP